MIQPMAFRMFSPPGRLLLEQTGEEAADLRAYGLGDRVADHRGELRHHVRRQPQLLERAPDVRETAQRRTTEQRTRSLGDVPEAWDRVADGAELVRRELVLRVPHHRAGPTHGLLRAHPESRG